MNNVNGIGGGTVTFNSNTSKYIFIGYDSNVNSLIVINTQNGTVEYSGALGSGNSLGELEYDNNSNKLFCLYRNININPNLFNFAEIDTLTAGITIIGSLDEILSISSTSSVYDHASSSYIFNGTDTSGVSRLYVINSNTGQIISKSTINGSIGGIECDNTNYALNKYTNVRNTIFTANDYLIYPNPSNGSVTLQYKLPKNEKDGELILYNMQGAEVKRYIVDNTFKNILLDNTMLPAGTYFYQLQTSKGSVGVKKMVVIK